MKKTAWYYAKDDQQQGPVTWEKLCGMATAGELSREDLVWSDGAPDWYPAGQAEGLVFGDGVSAEKSQEVEPDDASREDEEDSNDSSADEDRCETNSPPPPQQTSRQPPKIEDRGDLTGISFADAIRVAIDDGLTAFRVLILNPTGQLCEVHRQLGPLRAMMVGGVFAAVYFVCFVLGNGATLGFFYSLLGGLSMPLTLWGGVWAVRSACHAKGEYQTDIFLTGSALLPLGFATLIGGILGSAPLGLPILLGTFALCYAALILFRGFGALYGISEKVAILATPVVLAVSHWVVIRMMFFAM